MTKILLMCADSIAYFGGMEDRGQKTKDRGWGTEDRGRRTEDGGQKTEDRGQRMEDSAKAILSLLSSVLCPICPLSSVLSVLCPPSPARLILRLCRREGYATLSKLSGIDALGGAIQREPSGRDP